MSYVLEALKKAQAQREQGAVPGIHSLQVPYVAVEGKVRTNPKPVLWAIAGMLAVIVGLLVWGMGGGLRAFAPQTPVTAAAPPESQAAELALPAPAAPVAPIKPVAPIATVAPIAPASMQASEQQNPRRKEKAVSPPIAEAPKSAPSSVSGNLPKAQAKDAGPKVYDVADLPETVRRELPTLVISGGSYSSNPAQRLIIVNNQVFTEKSEPAPGVLVQRIEQNAAVLTFRGYSYRVGY